MGERPIDSFHFANLKYTTKDMYKDLMKDALKGIASLGTFKFRTVLTPKYLVLSEGNLHLIDTDTDDDISNDLLFNPSRLKQSSIQEIELTGSSKAAATRVRDDIKGYILSLATDTKPVELLIYSSLISTATDSNFSTQHETVIKEIVIANDFLKRLGELYPNLSTHKR